MMKDYGSKLVQDLDHISNYVTPKYDLVMNAMNEFFDSKSVLTKSYVTNRPSI